MAESSSDRPAFYRSIVFKNILLFLLILVAAVVPLAARYYEDSRDYEIQVLASKLEFFAERGATWVDMAAIASLTRPEHKDTRAYRDTLAVLKRIEREFGVDNAILMRRKPDGQFVYLAAGHGGFGVGEPVHIHAWFPATYKSTNDTWLAGQMMHSQLFGGRVGDREFDQFLQINTPLKRGGKVEAILMLNKFANPVAARVRMKTAKVLGLAVAILAAGLVLFSPISARMLRPLRHLTRAAGEVTRGNLDVALPPARGRDEVGRLAVAFRAMIEGLRQRDFIRDTFGRYISPEVVEEVLNSPGGLKLGGEMREVTFLVSDLRGFTALSARLGPQEVIQVINGYLERMVEVITRHRGTVDEFQGDGILAFFGAPVAAPDDPERAVACAIEMQRAMAEVNAEQRRRGVAELAMGIGINTGEVVVGNIGSERRTKYGAVGSAINAAYRIESYTVGAQVLLSPATYERVKDRVRLRGTHRAEFKGLEEPVTLYEVSGIEGNYACALPEGAPEELVGLAPPLAVACHPLEGKAVSGRAVPGRIARLSESSAEALLEGPVEPHSTLRVRLEGAGVSELYAKVVEVEPPGLGAPGPKVLLRFTSLPEDAKAYLARKRGGAG